MIHVAVDYHQPWSECKAMDRDERKAFIYGAALHRGFVVDWSSGKMRKPKKKPGEQ